MNLALQLEEIEKQVSALISENINLKKENKELTEQNTSFLTSVENLNNSVQELEKKNTELKADNSEWEKASDKWKNLYDSTNEQLTEAKALIKGMNEYLSTKPEFWSKEEQFEIAELSEKADQFVKGEENER